MGVIGHNRIRLHAKGVTGSPAPIGLRAGYEDGYVNNNGIDRARHKHTPC